MTIDRPPLTAAVLHVLLAIEGGALHGYAIMQAVEGTAGIAMGPGTIYGTLQRLSEAGLVDEVDPAEGEADRRRCYRLTAQGRAALKAEADRIASLAALLRERRLTPSEGEAT